MEAIEDEETPELPTRFSQKSKQNGIGSDVGSEMRKTSRRPSIFDVLSLNQSRLTRVQRDSSILSSCTFADTPSRTSDFGLSSSHAKKGHHSSTVKYQNTYKLEPDKRFSPHEVELLVEHVLIDHLEDIEYSESVGRRMVKIISDKILTAVKKLGYARYKLVVVVNIGQMFRQTLRVASRCLWQTADDTFAEVLFEGKTLWCTAVVYGVYQE